MERGLWERLFEGTDAIERPSNVPPSAHAAQPTSRAMAGRLVSVEERGAMLLRGLRVRYRSPHTYSADQIIRRVGPSEKTTWP